MGLARIGPVIVPTPSKKASQSDANKRSSARSDSNRLVSLALTPVALAIVLSRSHCSNHRASTHGMRRFVALSP